MLSVKTGTGKTMAPLSMTWHIGTLRLRFPQGIAFQSQRVADEFREIVKDIKRGNDGKRKR